MKQDATEARTVTTTTLGQTVAALQSLGLSDEGVVATLRDLARSGRVRFVGRDAHLIRESLDSGRKLH